MLGLDEMANCVCYYFGGLKLLELRSVACQSCAQEHLKSRREKGEEEVTLTTLAGVSVLQNPPL